jgi:hypothetical protein
MKAMTEQVSNRRMTDEVVAPLAFLIPISLVRFSEVKEASIHPDIKVTHIAILSLDNHHANNQNNRYAKLKYDKALPENYLKPADFSIYIHYLKIWSVYDKSKVVEVLG